MKTMQSPKSQRLSKRDSNLELFRIITMLLIVAHHYVVNSGLLNSNGPVYSNIHSLRSIFLLLVGAFGKTGINCFVLITGYFMCKSNITLKKFLKMWGEVVFYRILIWLIFILTQRDSFSIMGLVTRLAPFYSISSGFTPCFMAFWLLIPFLNILVNNMTSKQHLRLIGVLLAIYSGTATFSAWLSTSVTMNYVSWFCVLYFISSYVRLHEHDLLNNTKLWGCLTLGALILAITSVVYCAWSDGGLAPYYFLSDSNKLLAVVLAFSAFNFFRNIQIPYSKLINAFGGSTFGVLLIHAHSGTMRTWLWKETLDNVGAYSLGKLLPLHVLGSVLGVFILCACIDMLRISFIEKPLLSCYDHAHKKIQQRFKMAHE